MSLQGDIIRERIAAHVLPGDLALTSGIIEDSLPPGADIAGIEDAIAKARVAFGTTLFLPVAAASTSATAEAPAHETVTQRVAREHREQRQAPAAAGGESNPWHPGSISVTRQVMLLARDPAAAARMQAEAAR